MEEQEVEHSTQKNGMNPLIIIGLIAVVSIIGYMMMSGNKNTAISEEATNTAVENDGTASGSESSGAATSMEQSDAQIISVEAGSFYYKPNEIRIKKGEKVKIELKSVDMMHDFIIDELGLKIPITKSGETSTIEFIADQVGEFEFYCSVGQHRANGQVGTLIVEE